MAGKPKTPKVGYVLLALAGAVHPSGPRTSASGQPVQRYTKDLIRVGPWVHPNTGENLDVTAERLAHWAQQFSAMKAAGVRVPVPSNHTDDAAANRGWVEEMWVDGEVLMASIDIIGEDAIKEAARNEVSIYVPPRIVDGKGAEFKDAIAHVALTPTPVISGQKPFVAIAASRGGAANVPILRLATEGDYGMESLKKMAALLGITLPEDADEAAAWAAIEAACKDMQASKGKAPEQAKALETATTALAAARKELAEAKKGATFTPTEIKLSRKNRELEIGKRVDAGKIIPAQADLLRKTWCGDDAALALSLAPTADAIFDATLELIDANDAAKLGEVSKGQTFRLTRETPGGDATNGDWVKGAVEAQNKRVAKRA